MRSRKGVLDAVRGNPCVPEGIEVQQTSPPMMSALGMRSCFLPLPLAFEALDFDDFDFDFDDFIMMTASGMRERL